MHSEAHFTQTNNETTDIRLSAHVTTLLFFNLLEPRVADVVDHIFEFSFSQFF